MGVNVGRDGCMVGEQTAGVWVGGWVGGWEEQEGGWVDGSWVACEGSKGSSPRSALRCTHHHGPRRVQAAAVITVFPAVYI
jgi:hypothetical protein